MIETIDLIDPWMTGEADSDFAYTLRPQAGAEYTITAAEDIYTQDRPAWILAAAARSGMPRATW